MGQSTMVHLLIQLKNGFKVGVPTPVRCPVGLLWLPRTVASLNAEHNKASISIPNIDSTSGLAFGSGPNYLYAKIVGDNVIHDWNITFAAENSTITSGVPLKVQGDPSMNGTHMAALSNLYTDSEVLLMYQTQDGNITAYSQSLPGREWNATIVPIPED